MKQRYIQQLDYMTTELAYSTKNAGFYAQVREYDHLASPSVFS